MFVQMHSTRRTRGVIAEVGVIAASISAAAIVYCTVIDWMPPSGIS